jgi:signal transduction histidine kinase
MRYDKQNKRLDKLERDLNECNRLRESAEKEKAHLYSILDGIMHETRRLNSEIAAACDELARKISRGDFALIEEDSESIFYTSGLISSRLTFADFEINPESISRQTKLRAGIYKKFDKARRILSKAARRKHINIRLEGNSYAELDVIPAFELVPFVLLDNAIKYSPDGQEIIVSFQDRPTQNCRTMVTVTSTGPTVASDELQRLIERGFRGYNAVRSSIPGEGIGLFLADTLTRLANGQLRVSSSDNFRYSVQNVNYSEFTVILEFR